MKHVTIHKKVGETPLQALERVREKCALSREIPLAYAGRLDPMAEGKLLVLVSDTCKKQAQYHNLDKEYIFEVLFGFETDTGDILGIPTKGEIASAFMDTDLRSQAHSKPRTFTAPYPIFSSKTVRGKPLFLWALERKLNEIEIPEITTTLYNTTYLGSVLKTPSEIHDYIHTRIDSLPHVTETSKALGADFRRDEILERWDELLSVSPEQSFRIARFSVVCSSGTYIRSLAPQIARALGTTGLAFSICRTTIGTYKPLPFFKGIWTKKY